MALKKTRKAPAGPKVVPTKGTRYARSSTKQPKPRGIDPSDPNWGITNTSRFDGPGNSVSPSAVAKANSMFGTGNRNVPTGQDLLASKVKRQVY